MEKVESYRTIAGVHNMLDDPTGIRIHTTGPFLKGRPYQDYDTASFIDAAKRVRNDVDVASA